MIKWEIAHTFHHNLEHQHHEHLIESMHHQIIRHQSIWCAYREVQDIQGTICRIMAGE